MVTITLPKGKLIVSILRPITWAQRNHRGTIFTIPHNTAGAALIFVHQ